MQRDTDLRYLLPAPLRRLPADLWVVVGLTVATVLSVFLPVVRETPLRVVFGLAFVLFVPGYVFVAALFPEAGQGPTVDDGEADAPDDANGADDASTASSAEGGIDGIERVALSFGLSIAVVPLIGLVLNFTPWGIRLVPIVVSLSGFTLIATGVAARRRWALPAEERFSVPFRSWWAAGRAELLEPDSRTDAALNVLLVASILLATASVAYAVAVPKQGEAFTELYVLTENETGDLVADDYPTEFSAGEGKPLVVGIGNHEHRTVEYTVVLEVQRVERTGNNSTRTLEDETLRRFETALEEGETWMEPHNVTPTMTGTELRLAYLLYTDDVPADPTVENAYRDVFLWINVSRGENASAAVGSPPAALPRTAG